MSTEDFAAVERGKNVEVMDLINLHNGHNTESTQPACKERILYKGLEMYVEGFVNKITLVY